MPLVEFKEVGITGIIRDLPPHELAENAWSAGINVRFQDGKAYQVGGHIDWNSSICASPTFCLAVPQQSTTTDYWIYTSDTEVYAYNGTTNNKITSSSISATGQNTWTATILSGIAVLNYQQGKPLYWVFPPNGSTTLQALPDWSASWTTKVIRSFKNYLVALNTTESGTAYPYRVRWSHAADAGTVPTSWADNNPALDGGFNDILEGGDQIIDGAVLGDKFLIYKENSVWQMAYTGGSLVFNFSRLYDGIGLLSRNAIAAFGKAHLIVSPDDIYVHDGYSAPQSILTNRMRKYFFSDLARAHTDKIFCVPVHQQKEIWIFYPDLASGRISKALVFNYALNTLSVRDTPYVTGGNFGGVEYADVQPTWNATSGTWDDQTGAWDATESYREYRVVLVGKEDRKLFLMDQGRFAESAPISSYLERRALPLAPDNTMKYVRNIWPRVKCPTKGSINIYVGAHDKPWETPTYSGPFRFFPHVDEKVDCRVTGKYISVRFETGTSPGWQLDSFAIDFDIVGKH